MKRELAEPDDSEEEDDSDDDTGDGLPPARGKKEFSKSKPTIKSKESTEDSEDSDDDFDKGWD